VRADVLFGLWTSLQRWHSQIARQDLHGSVRTYVLKDQDGVRCWAATGGDPWLACA
jgi:hypothetical protein